MKSQQCFDHDEHFTTNHAQLGEGGDPNNQWGYCPAKNGCCADGKTWYACKNVSCASAISTRVGALMVRRNVLVVLLAALRTARLLAKFVVS